MTGLWEHGNGPGTVNPDKSVMWWEGRPAGRQASHHSGCSQGARAVQLPKSLLWEAVRAQGQVRFPKRKSFQVTIMVMAAGTGLTDPRGMLTLTTQIGAPRSYGVLIQETPPTCLHPIQASQVSLFNTKTIIITTIPVIETSNPY